MPRSRRAAPVPVPRPRTPGLRPAAVLGLCALLVLAGCSSQGGRRAADAAAAASATRSCDAPTRTYAVVTHGKQGDPFWDVVKTGAEAGGAAQCVAITYQGSGDPNEQSQAIDSAVAQGVDGLVVSMANPDALRGSVEAAVAAGIPVITVNSGADRSAEFGAVGHLGQGEDVAGAGAGSQLQAAGVRTLLCVIHEAGNIGLEDRCAGAARTLGGTTTNLQVDVANLAEAQSTITSTLQADPGIDGVLTLNSGVGSAAAAAVTAAGSSARVATFDVNPDVVTAVQEGRVLFAVDQQPYEQGYLAVVFLSLYLDNGNTVGGGMPVLTGPAYVTRDNADQVAQYTARGTR